MHPITRTRPLVSAEFILAQKTDRVLWNQPARIGLRLRKSNGFWTCQRSGASRLRGGFGGGLPREPGQGGLGTAKISSREIPAQGPQGGCGRTRPPPARAAGRFGPGSVQRPTHTSLCWSSHPSLASKRHLLFPDRVSEPQRGHVTSAVVAKAEAWLRSRRDRSASMLRSAAQFLGLQASSLWARSSLSLLNHAMALPLHLEILAYSCQSCHSVAFYV